MGLSRQEKSNPSPSQVGTRATAEHLAICGSPCCLKLPRSRASDAKQQHQRGELLSKVKGRGLNGCLAERSASIR